MLGLPKESFIIAGVVFAVIIFIGSQLYYVHTKYGARLGGGLTVTDLVIYRDAELSKPLESINESFFPSIDLEQNPKLTEITFNRTVYVKNYAGVKLYLKVEAEEWTFTETLKNGTKLLGDNNYYFQYFSLNFYYNDTILSGQINPLLISLKVSDLPIIRYEKSELIKIEYSFDLMIEGKPERWVE